MTAKTGFFRNAPEFYGRFFYVVVLSVCAAGLLAGVCRAQKKAATGLWLRPRILA